MFKSQIFTLDTSYKGPRLWICILPSYSTFIFRSKCLEGPFWNNLLRIVSRYSLSLAAALRLWSERILFWPLRCIFMENYRLGEFKKCVGCIIFWPWLRPLACSHLKSQICRLCAPDPPKIYNILHNTDDGRHNRNVLPLQIFLYGQEIQIISSVGCLMHFKIHCKSHL